MTKCLCIIVVLLFNCNNREDFIPIRDESNLSIQEIINLDTTLYDVREFTLFDTINKKSLVDNYGILADVFVKDKKVTIRQYLNFTDKELPKIYFTQYVLSIQSEKYCLNRTDSFDIDLYDHINKELLENEYDMQLYYFLGFFANKGNKEMKKFHSIQNHMYPLLLNQLHLLGLSNRYVINEQTRLYEKRIAFKKVCYKKK